MRCQFCGRDSTDSKLDIQLPAEPCAFYLVKLTQGKFALVDPDDFERVSLYKWHAHLGPGSSGFRARSGSKSLYMHRFIMNASSDDKRLIDHINGNPLDNRKANLRFASHTQNVCNSKIRSDNTSGFKGVHWFPHKNRWVAVICVEGKNRCLGYFREKEDAARAYEQAAHKYFGEFARLK